MLFIVSKYGDRAFLVNFLHTLMIGNGSGLFFSLVCLNCYEGSVISFWLC